MLRELGSAELRAARPGASEHLRAALDTARDDATRAAAAGKVAMALTVAGRVRQAMEVVVPVIAQLSRSDPEVAMRLDAELAGAAHVGLATTQVARERLDRYEGRLRGASPGERFVLATLAFQASFHGGSADKTSTCLDHSLIRDLAHHPLVLVTRRRQWYMYGELGSA